MKLHEVMQREQLVGDNLPIFSRGITSVLFVWLEQFPFDFDEPPKYPTLSGMLRFVQTLMKLCHRGDLSRKIQHRLDKFKITPFEDEGMVRSLNVLISPLAVIFKSC